MPNAPGGSGGLAARPASPGRHSSLAASLGVNSWPHGDAALEEALRVKGEQERTRQEYYRLESRQKVLDILNLAMHLGIPGPAIPLLFAGNEDIAAANTSRLATASQASSAAAAHQAALQAAVLSPGHAANISTGATALSSHGPFRFGQPSVPTYHLQPPLQPPMQQPMLSPPQPAIPGQPALLQSPVTPARSGAMDRSGSGSTARPNGRTGSPMQQQLQPAFTQGQPNSNSRFDVLSFDRPQETPDRFRLGHRATASAVPAFTAESSPAMAPHPVVSSQTTPTQVQPPQGAIHSSPFYPAQLSAPPQLVAAASGLAPQPQMSPPFTAQAGSPVQQGMPPPGTVPVMSVTPSRPAPVRGRGHGASSSTSDLQIHQWKPKQLNRDNRWKVVTSPFGLRSKGMAEEQSGPPPAKIQAQHGPSNTAGPEPETARSPPPRPTSASTSTSVIAAQNTKRRGHARSRSSVSQLPLPQPPNTQPVSPPVSRHDEGVAVLASLASEQNKVGYENIKSESGESQRQGEAEPNKQQRLPSLLTYLESQAKHNPSSVQRAFPGNAAQDVQPQNDPPAARPASGGPEK